MTEQQQQHPDPCDTCTDDECCFNKERWETTWHNDIYYFMRKKGCASHSARTAPSRTNLISHTNAASLQKIIDDNRAEAAAKARSDIIKTFAEVEYLHDVDGITYPDLYNEFIERLKKLRRTGGEPR